MMTVTDYNKMFGPNVGSKQDLEDIITCNCVFPERYFDMTVISALDLIAKLADSSERSCSED